MLDLAHAGPASHLLEGDGRLSSEWSFRHWQTRTLPVKSPVSQTAALPEGAAWSSRSGELVHAGRSPGVTGAAGQGSPKEVT